jgi:ribosomal protein L37E
MTEARTGITDAAAAPSFTCPRCDRTSYHPDDRKNGYCGACHDYTGTPTP